MKTKTNWRNLQLQDVFEIATGKTPSKKREDFFGGNIPFVKPGDLDKNKYIETTEDSLTKLGLAQISELPPNTVLVSCIGNLGKKALLKTTAGCNQQINAILPSPYIEPLFIYYYIDILKPWLAAHASATTVTILNKNTFATAPIPVPPMAEQKRIVKKIEELFGVIDEQVKRLEATHAALVSYRQSILKKLLSNPVYPQVSFNDGIKKIIGGSTPSKTISAYYEGHIPFMTVKDMTSPRPQDTAWHITQEAVDNCSTHIIPANTLITATRVGLGKTVLMPFPVAINQDLKALVLNKNKVKTRFFEFVLNAKTTEIISKSRGTTVKGITLEDFKSIKFYLPALAEQQKIVDEIERTFYSADQVQKAVQNALEQAKQLKQSILKRAFEGKLVPQDPNDKPVDLTQIKKDKHK